MDALGFTNVGYGCMTCIGNSGPLEEPVSEAVKVGDLVCCGILSGNRNFEGRIHPDTRANYLASPPLVIAYALAGRVDVGKYILVLYCSLFNGFFILVYLILLNVMPHVHPPFSEK